MRSAMGRGRRLTCRGSKRNGVTLVNERTQQSVAAEAKTDANQDGRREAREAVREERIEVGGLTIRYLTAGEGPPLVLLHGVGDNASDWRWVMPILARTHRVYAPDLPGSGGTSKPSTERYSPAFFERFIGAFLDALGVDRATVVGNSLGGLAGLRFALAEPERVAALGLVDSAGLGRRVSPALRTLSVPGYGRLTVAWGKRRPRGSWAARRSFSHAPGVSPGDGSRSSTAWRGYRGSWRHSLPLSAPRLVSGDSGKCS
jgi:pimeloyl-ACP methyl ester carboxylesterase